MTHDQLYNLRPLPELSNYSTYISGLYLCSSSTHPGGGVSGIPGYNAAMKILEDIKSKRINI
jgi:phytoene dehydrogenase-like protein